MISDILLDVVFLHDASYVDLFRFFKFILLFFLDILLHHCIYLTTGHVVLDLLSQLVEDALVFDHHSQQGLLELIVGESYLIVLVHLFVLGEVSEYLGEFLCIGDKGVDLEDEIKVVPRLDYDLGVVFLLS